MSILRRLAIPLLIVVVVGGIIVSSATEALQVETTTVTRGPVREAVEEEGKTRVRERFVLSAPVNGRLLRVELEEGDRVEQGQIVARLDALTLESRTAAAEARMRSLAEQLRGVETKKPKPEEVERARVLAESAQESHAMVERELEQCRAEHAQAEREHRRAKELRERGSASPESVERAALGELQARERVRSCEVQLRVQDLEARAALLTSNVVAKRAEDFEWETAATKEQLDAMKAELVVIRDDLNRAEIQAPSAGVILEIYQEDEVVLAAGTPVLAVGDLSRLEVEADFLSEDAARMRAGMPVEIFGRALGRRVVPGTIKRVHPSGFEKLSSLGVEQQRVTVVCDFEAVEGLGDRYRVDVRVILDEVAAVPVVPESALFRWKGDWHVFRVTGSEATLTPVETGLGDGRVREVTSGLAEGDEVVLHPPKELEDGARVEPLPRE